MAPHGWLPRCLFSLLHIQEAYSLQGWELVNTVSGRFLVALPYNGSPGASFGGDSIPASK